MKTLRLTLLVCGIVLSNLAFSFSSINLLTEGNYANLADKLQVMTPLRLSPDIFQTAKTNALIPLKTDTIIIDLQEVVITQGFPESSHDCLQCLIGYPEFAKKIQLQGVVAINMCFNRNGDVEILQSFGSDPRLESYVLGKVMGLHLKDCTVQINKPYNLRFAFRLI